jgi:osmoprotectant transport system permease protein
VNYLETHAGRVASLALFHIELVAVALAVACAIAFPLGLVAARRPRIAGWLLGTLGALYTIPSLALLAIFVQFFGLGPVPIFVALVLYAQFMLARGVVAGISGVDPAQVDAARGLGMSPFQLLLRVEIPQALPVMIGGLRIAAIASIAIATLGGYVGGGGLGVLIFNGLTLHQSSMIVAGSVGVCVLALIADGAARLAERGARASLG